MTSMLNSECLSGCVPTVLLGIGAPLFAWRPKESVSEHLALAFEVGLARGVLLVGFLRFLQHPGSAFGLSQPLPAVLSVRNI